MPNLLILAPPPANPGREFASINGSRVRGLSVSTWPLHDACYQLALAAILLAWNPRPWAGPAPKKYVCGISDIFKQANANKNIL